MSNDIAGFFYHQAETLSLIFTSRNRETALKGYEVEAVRCLAKPVNFEKLEEALMYCCKFWHNR